MPISSKAASAEMVLAIHLDDYENKDRMFNELEDEKQIDRNLF